jgi:D-psicose/D-tagatose/L-ribulose 3-epimerase
MAHKLGINLMVWSGQVGPHELRLLPMIKEMGYDGVELPLFDITALDIPAIRAMLAQTGLECTVSTALPAGLSLIDEDAAGEAIAWLRQIVEAAAGLGSPLVCGPLAVPVGEQRGRRYTDAEWACGVRALRQVSATAEDLGVTLAFEPLNRFETFLLNTAADGVRLAQEVDSPAFGLLLDTFHMHIEEKSTPDAILHSAGHIKHFHASENDRGVVGTGQVVWPRVFNALQGTGYRGWIVVESFNSVIPELAGATCVWRSLAESPEALARESLAFLRQGL